MADILSDRDIRKLLDVAIKGGDARLINPNGIELRAGNSVKFLSTGETRTLSPGQFLKVGCSEAVLISSLEILDFSTATLSQIRPGKMLMGLISPTTTMMREGIGQVTTKVDSGFKGRLNWMIRNYSNRDLILQHGESIFKLTLFELEGNEIPDVHYGDKEGHKYQNADGIIASARHLPVDIPKENIVGSSREKLDPKQQLRDAGHPFDHIGTELIQLHGKFEMVSKEVAGLAKDIEDRTGAIQERTDTILGKLDENRKIMETDRKGLEQHAENLFSKKFNNVIYVIIGAGTLLYGIFLGMQKMNIGDGIIITVALIGGVAVLCIARILSKPVK